MPITVSFRDELTEPVSRELDHDFTKLRHWLLKEHNEDGTHRFPTATTAESSLTDTIVQIIDRGQDRGQWWKNGPWRLDDPAAATPNVAALRVPDPAAGTYNNYAPVGLDTSVMLVIEPAGNITITGLKVLEGALQKRFLILRNRDSAFTITLSHEHTGSLSRNRFDLPGSADHVLGPGQAIWLFYEPGRDRWTAAVTGMKEGTIGDGAESATLRKAQVDITIDGDGQLITTGAKKIYARLPYDFEINGWEIVGDQSGSIVCDIWYDTYANFPPTVADTITASAKPTVTTATKATSSTLTGWTTDLLEGRYLEINVDSVTSFTKVNLFLYGRKAN
jgi:hypothetical protein